MNAYIVEDAAGLFFQFIDPEQAQYITKDGEKNVYGQSELGGWYDLSCRPVPEQSVTHPVTVMWRRDN